MRCLLVGVCVGEVHEVVLLALLLIRQNLTANLKTHHPHKTLHGNLLVRATNDQSFIDASLAISSHLTEAGVWNLLDFDLFRYWRGRWRFGFGFGLPLYPKLWYSRVNHVTFVIGKLGIFLQTDQSVMKSGLNQTNTFITLVASNFITKEDRTN